MSSNLRKFTCRHAVRNVLWASLAAPALVNAQGAASAQGDDGLEEVLVTGYRASLELAADAKRKNISFSDSIFSEDIGKFPDINLAESLQRIPGVQISRDLTGEGTSVAIRGLGREFTQITLNGAPVQTASDSNIDGVSETRGADLVLFPTELFHELSVTKTPTARQVEGGVAANVDLRIARPFDKKGFHISYAAKANYQEVSGKWSPRLGVYVSDTWDTAVGEFGVLAGIAYSKRVYQSEGFNTPGQNAGWITVSPGVSCPASQTGCNPRNDVIPNTSPSQQYQPGVTNRYGNASQTWAATVPAGYSFGANGLNPGNPLTICGANGVKGGTSNLSCEDLSYALWPRLPRPDVLFGERKTTSGILALQWAPSDSLSFYLDSLYSEADHPYNRNDLNVELRSKTNLVPVDVTLDQNKVVTKATIANPSYLSENRPYREETDFVNFNLGGEWNATDKLTLSTSFNYNQSDWYRSTNTYLLGSVQGDGSFVTIENTGDGAFRITPTNNLNNPNMWTWNQFRINPVERQVWQRGGRIDGEYAFADAFKLGAGVSRDSFHRVITDYAATTCATDGGTLNGCNTVMAAVGAINAKAAMPTAQAVSQYMQLWPHGQLFDSSGLDVGLKNGWALPDYEAMAAVLNAAAWERQVAVGLAGGTELAGWRPRILDEKMDGAYVEANGQLSILGNLRYNVGVRYVKTSQTVRGLVSRQMQVVDSEYNKVLPSFNLSSDLGYGFVARAAASKTMTRPQPGDIAPNQTPLTPDASSMTIGNPDLAPYTSDNYDLGLEWYFDEAKLGYVALNLWQKKIKGYASQVITSVPFRSLGIDLNSLVVSQRDSLTTRSPTGNPLDATVNVNQFRNTSELITLDGVEATYVQPLDFLLNGSGLSLNYTHIDQKSTGGLPNAPSSAIVGLAPYTYNITAFYEDFGFSGRLSYSVRDAHIASLGRNDNNVSGDNWMQKAGYLDAAFSYKLPLSMDLTVSLDLQNLTKETQKIYFRNDAAMPYRSFAPGRQYLLGVSGKF
jgi:TonB-dependent receptor